MPSDSDDLDWLYRRDPARGGGRPPREAETTRAMSQAELEELQARGAGRQRQSHGPSQSPSHGRSTPSDRPREGRGRGQDPGPDRREPVRPVPAPPPEGEPRGPRGPQPPRPPSRRRRHPVRRTLAVLAVLLLAVLTWLVAVPVHAWSTGNEVDAFTAEDRPARQPGQLFLLVGSDSREGLSAEEQSELGTGSTEGQRADTMLLLYLPPSGPPALISLPRDSYLEIPGNGSNKLNAAYSFGGAPLLTQTVEQNTGLRLDGYVEVGFGGFVSVIDALGGVDICVDEAISDRDSHLDVEAGCQEMDGTTALGYARMRKADARGDLGRIERQREVMAAMADRAVSPVSVINPVRYWRLNRAAAQSLTTDPGTGVLDAARLALAMGRISSGSGLTLTVPIGDPDAYTPVGSSVLWDETEAPAMFEAIAGGDAEALAQYADR